MESKTNLKSLYLDRSDVLSKGRVSRIDASNESKVVIFLNRLGRFIDGDSSLCESDKDKSALRPCDCRDTLIGGSVFAPIVSKKGFSSYGDLGNVGVLLLESLRE